ncbi:MAG TPA: helicase-associated domain-containing protein [Anaerolineales bacterium]|nr:helicase-associated domain-containing protein [Anaerolineales bacterium]
MQPLRRTLEDQDLGHLHIVAELWEIDLPPGPARPAAAALAQAMLAPGAAAEIAASLPAPADSALTYLQDHGGRAPLADLARIFGPLNRVGPGRRDREKPWRDTTSPLDGLYYRGLLALAFADTPAGPQEFAFIPEDLLDRLPQRVHSPEAPLLGQPAPEPGTIRAARYALVDDATTLLAALRRKPSRSVELPTPRRQALSPFLRQPGSLDFLLALLLEHGLLRQPPIRPDPDATRDFLELPPARALSRLGSTWLQSRTWNDLARTPGLSAATWPNDPLVSRSAALMLLEDVPPEVWWSLNAFLEAVRRERPAFQRPAGDFDSWYVQDQATARVLSGFGNWDLVEGRFLRFMIEGPLAWLGAIDLGLDGSIVVAFRRSARYGSVVGDTDADAIEANVTPASATVAPDGTIRVPESAPMAQRYQIARVTSWVEAAREGNVYRITPSALSLAKAQGLSSSHVRAILEHASGRPIPPNLAAAMGRWERRAAEGRIEPVLLLRVSDPRVLRELKGNRATSRYLGEAIGPTSVAVRSRHVDVLLAAAARLGLLLDPPDAGGESP